MSNTPLTSVIQELRSWLQAFARTRFDSLDADESRCIPKRVFLEFGERGLLALQLPSEQGGLGLSSAESLEVMVQLGAIDLSLGACVAVQNYLTGLPVRCHASPEVSRKLVPDMIAGRQLVAFALTERSAGSDPRRIEATARRQVDGTWEINGTKIWSGMAAWAGAFVTFAHALSETGETLGMTGFLLDAATPGVECGPATATMGLRGMVRNEVHFNKVRCDDTRLLGEPGRGRGVARESMSVMRLYMAGLALGASKRALQLALRHVSKRQIATGSMAAHPVVLTSISEITNKIRAMEALLACTAAEVDRAKDHLLELFLACKIIASELAGEIVDACIQLTGGRGYVEANGLALIYRDIRAFRIIEGPTEALAAHLGGSFLIHPEKLSAIGFCREHRRALEPIVERLLSARRYVDSSKGSYADRSRDLLERHQAGRLIADGLLAAAVAEWAQRDQIASGEPVSEWSAGRLSQAVLEFDAAMEKDRDWSQILAAAENIANGIGSIDQAFDGLDRQRDKVLFGS